jgi:hypothetical protein
MNCLISVSGGVACVHARAVVQQLCPDYRRLLQCFLQRLQLQSHTPLCVCRPSVATVSNFDKRSLTDLLQSVHGCCCQLVCVCKHLPGGADLLNCHLSAWPPSMNVAMHICSTWFLDAFNCRAATGYRRTAAEVEPSTLWTSSTHILPSWVICCGQCVLGCVQ